MPIEITGVGYTVLWLDLTMMIPKSIVASVCLVIHVAEPNFLSVCQSEPGGKGSFLTCFIV